MRRIYLQNPAALASPLGRVCECCGDKPATTRYDSDFLCQPCKDAAVAADKRR